jgi:hypothetical protein
MKTQTERRPLEYYLDSGYPITLEVAPEGGYFVEIEDLSPDVFRKVIRLKRLLR